MMVIAGLSLAGLGFFVWRIGPRLGGSGVERGQSVWVSWAPEDSIVLTE